MTRKHQRLALFIVLLVTLLVYLPGIGGPFLLDDFSNFQGIELDSLAPDDLQKGLSGSDLTLTSRPVARLTLLLNNHFFGTVSASSHKLVNVLLHLLIGGLLYLLTIRLLAVVRPGDDSAGRLTALVVMALWLLHPLQVSTVLYAVQRMTQLSSLFTLLAILLYINARQAERFAVGRDAIKIFLLIPLLTVLAFFSKESGILVTLYLLAIEWLLFGFRTTHGEDRGRLRLAIAVLVGAPLLLAIAYLATHLGQLVNYTGRDFTLYERLLTQPVVLLFHLGQLLLPNLATMGLFHDDFPIARVLDLRVLSTGAVLLIFLVTAFTGRRRWPLVSLGILWFFISHALESSFLPLEMVFEHRNYLAIYGPLLGLVLVAQALNRRLALRLRATGLVIVAIALALTGLTFLRVQQWSSVERFAAAHLVNHPGSWRTHHQLALLAFMQGDRERAMDEMEKVNAIVPGDTSHHVVRILAWCPDRISRAEIDAAVDATRTIQRGHPARTILYAIRDIENRHANGNCPAITDADLLLLTGAMVENRHIKNRPLKFHLHARALAANGRIDAAQGFYRRSWEARPANLQPAVELVQLLRDNGRAAEACATGREIGAHIGGLDAVDPGLLDALDVQLADCPTGSG